MSFLFGVAVRKPTAASIKDSVAAGTNFSLSIQNGRAWGWGYGGSGRIGNNSESNNPNLTPISVLGAVKTFCDISAGASHSLAIDKNGRAWAWGINAFGQLGNNSTVSRLTPVSVLGAPKTFCEIAGSLGNHSLAIDKNGRLWAWGDNSNGRLGNNTIISQRTPISVLGAVKTFCKIAVGNAWSAAIDRYGRVWCWGNGGDGRLANGSTVSSLTPRSILGANKTFCHIGAGNATTAAIDKNGLIWSWGFNNSGQLGNAANTPQCTPVSLAGTRKTFCKISLSNGQTIALDKYGGVWAWGFNANALLGDNSVTARNTPVSLAGAKKTFCQIAAGSQHSLAIDKYGNTWAWGPNTNGQLGANINTFVRTPKSIMLGANKTFCTVASGGNFTIAIDRYGRAWSWGNNATGFLGDNSLTARFTPISVQGAVKTFCKVSGLNQHTLALTNAGRIWGWGRNTSGRLGVNELISEKRTPASIAGAVKIFCEISAGGEHSAAIQNNGRLWCWGGNFSGSLGINTGATTSRLTPVSVQGAVKTFCKVSASYYFSHAIDKYGRAWGWGINDYGMIGNNDSLPVITPVSVLGAVKTFCAISNNYRTTLAIDKNGRAWGWGYNGQAELGIGIGPDNDGSFFMTPMSVAGAVKTFCKIAAGEAYSLAIDKYGILWAWGTNVYGELGLGSGVNFSNTPRSVLGARKTFCEVSANFYTSYARDQYGKFWGWGNNSDGQIAIQPENRVVLTPVRVCNI